MTDAPDPWEERRSGQSRPRDGDVRSPWERDRARIIHSAGFRRLQAKTQVLGLSAGDFHRTRLTHTMEVAQIARGIVLHLRNCGRAIAHTYDHVLDVELAEAVALAHDLGHPPFGHGGEIGLNYALRRHGGFEGNGQTLRLVSLLEPHTPEYGLDLTRRTLLGVLKYPVRYSQVCRTRMPDEAGNAGLVSTDWRPPKCYLDVDEAVVDWVLAPLSLSDRERFTRPSREPSVERHGGSSHKSFDAEVMELADDIAYAVHDLEDGIALGLITREDWQRLGDPIDPAWASGYEGLRDQQQLLDDLFGSDPIATHGAGDRRKRAVGEIIHSLITSVTPDRRDGFEEPLLSLTAAISPPAARLVKSLKDLVYNRVISLQTVQTAEHRGRYIVARLYEALNTDPRALMNADAVAAYDATSTELRPRAVADYVAGMTDVYAERMYNRLFVPGHGSVFDRL